MTSLQNSRKRKSSTKSLTPIKFKVKTLRKKLVSVAAAFFLAFKPIPDIAVSTWNEANRSLSSENSAEPGKLDISRAEYQRAWLDTIRDEECQSITIQAASQVGKSEFELSVIAWYMAEDQCPILVVLPTGDDALNYSKERLSVMIQNCKPLRGKVKDAKSKDSENTLLSKKYPGGRVSLTGAHSPAGLCSRPIRVVLFDEVDRYPASAGNEGDPVSLGEKRATTYWNKLIIRISSPTISGYSRINKAFEQGSQEHYHVNCPHCGVTQKLAWSNVRWDTEEVEGKEVGLPETARYVCPHCTKPWTESQKNDAVSKGIWIAKYPERKKHRSFAISSLYSPWVTLAELAEEWIAAQSDIETLKTFINTRLGEVWVERGDTVDEDPLYDRREDYNAKEMLPEGVSVITAAFDVQDHYVEGEIVGWGIGEESWSLEHLKFYGDPSTTKFWKQIDGVLRTRRYNHPCGLQLMIAASCIDSGGHHTDAVYKFCGDRWAMRCWAIKGSSTPNKPILPAKPSRSNKAKIRLFILGTDTAKDVVYSSLAQNEPGPGFCHFPLSYEKEYFKQITSEQKITKYKAGVPYRKWEKKPNRRNEILDCRVYNLAALRNLRVDLEAATADLYRHAVAKRANSRPVEPSVNRAQVLSRGVEV